MYRVSIDRIIASGMLSLDLPGRNCSSYHHEERTGRYRSFSIDPLDLDEHAVCAAEDPVARAIGDIYYGD